VISLQWAQVSARSSFSGSTAVEERAAVFRNAATRSLRRPARVLIVDDDPLFAGTLALLVGRHDDVAVVGCARDGAEAVDLALRLRPDVVLMDVQMPIMDGIEATRRIVTQLRSTRVVMITSCSDPDVAVRSFAAGAAAFVRKGCEPEKLLDEIAAAKPIPLTIHRATPLPAG